MAEPIDQNIVDALKQGIWTEEEQEQALTMMLAQVEEKPAEQHPEGEVE
ncbi:hypothetical protein [Roseicella sp. DB1501]|nr:hypothetical protein [Roseicella sp. DB1501]NOG72258.1 hypothetical protein [Roseicella sp. DB1501]